MKVGQQIVMCLNDAGDYVPASEQVFDDIAEAIDYANSISDVRKPLVLEVVCAIVTSAVNTDSNF
jgi:hypothetical protein